MTSMQDAVAAPRREVTVIEQVAGVVTARRSAPAVTEGSETLTYGELWQRASGVARQLRGSGVGAGAPVGVCLPRSADLVVAVLGVALAEAVAVVLDPANPDGRLRQMVTDAGAAVVIGRPGVDERLGGTGGPVRVVDPATVDLVTVDPAGELDDVPSPRGDDAAYTVYTSGSTGAPKGVVVGHAGLANLVSWHRRAFALTGDDRCSLVASPGFDASLWEIWPALATGACLQVVPEDAKNDPWALRDWLLAAGTTVAFLPTPLAEAVTTLDWPAATPLRVLLTGGDRLHRRPPAGLPFVLVNNYGVSEATVVSTSGVVAPGVEGARSDSDGVPTIGAAIDGVQLDVVDGDLQPVGVGEVGELLVTGVSVALRYVGEREHGAGGLVLDPSDPRRRRYRTGDLVRARADGQVEYVGRVDEQVQIRGFRVEPAEVAAALHAHPAVGSAVVTAGSDPGQPRLTAHLVLADGAAVSDAELREHLAARLPAHMVPALFVRVTALPLALSGKVDRAALAAEEVRSPEGTGPTSELEAAVAAIVAEKLGVPTVDVEDDFFTLGGHSLLGAQLIMRISADFEVEVSLRALFDNPTVVGLSAEVERLLVDQIEQMSEESVLDAASRVPAEGTARP